MAMEAGLLQAIGGSNGKSITAEALSKTSGFDKLLISTTLLEREIAWLLINRIAQSEIMRLVTCVGYCDEVGESEYAANEVTYLSNTSGARYTSYLLSRVLGSEI